jgi:hypothetical protein
MVNTNLIANLNANPSSITFHFISWGLRFNDIPVAFTVEFYSCVLMIFLLRFNDILVVLYNCILQLRFNDIPVAFYSCVLGLRFVTVTAIWFAFGVAAVLVMIFLF